MARTGVCADDPPAAGNRIVCNPGNVANGLDVAARNVSISVTTPTRFRPALDARAEGASGIIAAWGIGCSGGETGPKSQSRNRVRDVGGNRPEPG